MFDANVKTVSKDVLFLYQLICVEELILKPQMSSQSMGQKFHSSARNSEGNQEPTSNSFQSRTSALGRITPGYDILLPYVFNYN